MHRLSLTTKKYTANILIEWKKKQMDSLFSSSKFLWSKPQIDKIPTDFSKVITLGHYLVGIQEKKKKRDDTVPNCSASTTQQITDN